MGNFNKKKIISKVAPVISGLQLYRLFEPFYSGMGQILTFHRVVEDSMDDRIHNHQSLEVSPEQLEQTILFYKKKNYAFFSLDDLHHALTEEKPKQKFVVFTFDDGYRDNFTNAYPILKKHNIPFCIYVTTNFPDQKAILWWYLLEDFLKEETSINFHWEGKEYLISSKTISEKEKAFDQIRTLINQSFSKGNFQEMLEVIFGKKEVDYFSYVKKMAMSWEEIKLISQDPLVTIGAHTVNHFPLTRLDSNDLEFEILQSKKILEKYIQQPVEHFAYPFGKVSEASFREFEMVKSLGLKTATTTRIGNVFAQHKNYLECLPRISLNQVSTSAVLNMQASGMLSFIYHRGKKVISN
ncbi:MAG: polysaccharide deacetylase family protein [Saprospiraceae bacterium]